MQVLDTVDLDAIRALHQREEFFWLDLDDPGDADLDALGELLGIPDLAIEDSKEFGERPKLDDYGERVLIVFYGAHDIDLVEVHVHVSGKEVVTIRRAPCAHLWEARERAASAKVRTEQDLVYRVLDALASSLRALTDRYATEVEHLEEIAFERPKPADRRRMSELRSELFRLQQIVQPQREMLARGGDLIENLPGLERDIARHPFRDVHDDLVIIANEIDYLRELLSEAVNVLINQMAGRLTIVATIFLPLTFATGFFGMNFGWLVRHIDSAESFLILGVGGMILPLTVVAVLLLRAGYLRGR
ncbi:MAG TPA: magnesium transporter CorA family protein [Solirubrobacteraceae bacterium]